MKIGEKTLKALGELITNALLTHQGPLNMAYTKNGQEDLKIGLKAVIKPGPADGNFKLKADIDYVIEKATDSFSTSVDEKQMSLNLDEPTKVCPMREDKAEIFVSVCDKCKDRESIIVSDGKSLPVWHPSTDTFDAQKITHHTLIQFMPCTAWADDDYKVWCAEMIRRADVYIASVEKPKLKKIAGGKA